MEATKTALDETLIMLENLENVTNQEGATIMKKMKEKTKEIAGLKRQLEDVTLKCVEYERELKERVVELDSLKEKIKNGMKVMEKQEFDFKQVTRHLAELKEEMATGSGSQNPIDLVDKNAEISQLQGQLEEVQNISRKQDRELLERDAELNNLKEKIKQGIRAMAKQEEDLKTSKERLSEASLELARHKEEVEKSAEEGEVHAEQVAHLKEELTAAKDKLAEVQQAPASSIRQSCKINNSMHTQFVALASKCSNNHLSDDSTLSLFCTF